MVFVEIFNKSLVVLLWFLHVLKIVFIVHPIKWDDLNTLTFIFFKLQTRYLAADHGQLEAVRLLVEVKANLNQPTLHTGSSPLQTAAYGGFLDIVRFLVEAGANIDQCATLDGLSPLQTAVVHGHLEVVQFLVSKRANIEQIRRNDGSTALHLATSQGHFYMVKYLLALGAKSQAQGSKSDIEGC